MFTRTKIVCTIGPSVASFQKILELIDAGMNVARLNFSHGTHEEHLQTINHLKKARETKGVPLAIMLDTRGPEIRVGKLPEGALTLTPGQRISIPNDIPITPFEAVETASVGMNILFDDGYIASKVVEKKDHEIIIEIKNPGILKSNKRINIPGAQINLPALTQKDIEDLKFGCQQDVDYVAASFIRSAHHVLSIKELLTEEGKPDILVIAKIESTQGVENFDSIVQVSDGIMVARGDLGVEVDLAQVPALQKMMIRKSYQMCKPVITATQMLESMMVNPRPTRAEVSDVANAIYDCTSCVMLSGETAVGKYPIETVQQMKKIIQETEADFNYKAFFEHTEHHGYHDLSSAVSLSAVKLAYSSNAKCIYSFLSNGQNPRLFARLRPEMPILTVTSSKKAYHQTALNWGIIPLYADAVSNVQDAFCIANKHALTHGIISFGDVIVITSGVHFSKQTTTNMLLVEHVGEVLVRGHKGLGPKVSGPIAFVLSPEAYTPEELTGKLVVILYCDNAFLPILKNATGLIVQNYIGDTASEKYATLIAKTYNISVITRADGAMSSLNVDEEVTLDPQKGLIYRGSEEVPPCPDLSIL